MRLRFTKMQGAGNDFVVLDATRAPLALDARACAASPTAASASAPTRSSSSSRATTPGVDFGYRIFNGGSGDEVEHCGNGARCFVRYVRDKGLTDKRTLVVETDQPPRSSCACRTTAASPSTWARPTSIRPHCRSTSRGLAPRARDAGLPLWPLELATATRRRRRGLDGQPARGADRRRRRRRAGRDAGPADREARALRAAASMPASCRSCRARRSACACTSAAPARRWPAAPAHARRSRPASGSAWLDAQVDVAHARRRR